MQAEMKFILTIGLIAAATAAGYLSRRFGLLREGLARPIMTVMMVAGYPLVGFLTIWKIRLQPSDADEVFGMFSEKLCAGLPGFEWRCRVKGWAYMLARNAANDVPTVRRQSLSSASTAEAAATRPVSSPGKMEKGA